MRQRLMLVSAAVVAVLVFLLPWLAAAAGAFAAWWFADGWPLLPRLLLAAGAYGTGVSVGRALEAVIIGLLSAMEARRRAEQDPFGVAALRAHIDEVTRQR